MPISMIDLASITPKSMEASATRVGEMAKEAGAQQSLGAAFNNDIKKNSQSTVKMTQAENPEYRFDAKEGGNGFYGQSSRKKKEHTEEKNEKEKASDPYAHGGFDVRI